MPRYVVACDQFAYSTQVPDPADERGERTQPQHHHMRRGARIELPEHEAGIHLASGVLTVEEPEPEPEKAEAPKAPVGRSGK